MLAVLWAGPYRLHFLTWVPRLLRAIAAQDSNWHVGGGGGFGIRLRLLKKSAIAPFDTSIFDFHRGSRAKRLGFAAVAVVASTNFLSACTNQNALREQTARLPLATTPFAPASDKQVKFNVTPYSGPTHSTLEATANGRTQTIIAESESQCLSIVDQKDFDADGYVDALVEHINGCGGNCCGNSYFFVSYDGNGKFRKSQDFGYSWSNGPTIERWKEHWSVQVLSENQGVNTDDVQEVTERFVLDSGKAVRVEQSHVDPLPAEIELKSSSFDPKVPDERRSIAFDLDNDGVPDTISATLVFRWGTLDWIVNFANGKTTEGGGRSCKRIGVLRASSHGVRDLVCDLNTVLHWDGRQYKAPDE